ncbi:MAG: hypothetical protein AAF337_02920 [Pseudomonadota bacterium]
MPPDVLMVDDNPNTEVGNRAFSRETPRHYLYAITQAAHHAGLRLRSPSLFAGPGSAYFTWRPSLKALWLSVAGRLIFLTFGLPERGPGLRRRLARLRFAWLLARATDVIAMDRRTHRVLKQSQVRGRVHYLPPLVDEAFFASKAVRSRAVEMALKEAGWGSRVANSLLVVGDADRDEGFVQAVAERYPIIRVRRQAQSVEASGNILRLSQIDYQDLIWLYQNTRCVLVPIAQGTSHAAGMTTVTEALCAGAQVLSSSRLHSAHFAQVRNFASTLTPADVFAQLGSHAPARQKSHVLQQVADPMVDVDKAATKLCAIFNRAGFVQTPSAS